MNDTMLSCFCEEDGEFDPVMEEVYAVRRMISAKYGHDVYRIAAAMSKRQCEDEAHGIKYVRLPIVRKGVTA